MSLLDTLSPVAIANALDGLYVGGLVPEGHRPVYGVLTRELIDRFPVEFEEWCDASYLGLPSFSLEAFHSYLRSCWALDDYRLDLQEAATR